LDCIRLLLLQSYSLICFHLSGSQETCNDGGDDNEEEDEEDEQLTEEEKQVLVGAMHRVLKPFILRRVKADVATDLPHKVVKCRL
jgi:SNF2 family DNA or RNA helicase